LTGFGAGGMQTLTDAIARKLGDRLTCSCTVERIERDGSRWRMVHASGSESADAVVIATPADAAASLLAPLDADMAALLASIPYAPMRVAGVAFRNADVPMPLDGFGFLAARGQGIRILGALYTSAMYPQQAPAGSAYLRVFLGGSVDPEAVALDSKQLRATVLRDLRTVLHIDAAPIAFHEAVWAHAIPQYRLGHGALVSDIERRATMLPGLFLAGNAYRGLGLSDTASDALAVAAAVEAKA
jgi:oxygen-dependent protoporphyrinogen oxidase